MKKSIVAVMAITAALFQSSCASIPEEVPEALLQIVIDDSEEEMQFDDCDAFSYEIEHHPDTKSHTDSVDIRLLAKYPYGDYEVQISGLVYQYNKSNDNWVLISNGRTGDSEVTWKNIEELYDDYWMPGAYLQPSVDEKNYKTPVWGGYLCKVDVSEFESGPYGDTMHLTGKYEEWYTLVSEISTYDSTIVGFTAVRDYSEYHKALIFQINHDGPIVFLTPEEGLGYLCQDPTDHGKKPLYAIKEYFQNEMHWIIDINNRWFFEDEY